MVVESESLVPDDVVRRRLPLEDRGVEIAVQDWGGDGPLALLLHANGFCGALWTPVAERLRAQFRVVTMDTRGQGDSSQPAAGLVAEAFDWAVMAGDAVAVAETLLKESGDRQVGLGLGHSFGGSLTLFAEASRPGLYRRIVLVDPVVPPTSKMLETLEWGARPPAPMAEGARRRRSHWPSREEARAQLEGKALFARWTPRALAIYLAEGLRDRPDGGVELKCDKEVEALVFEAAGSVDLFEQASRVDPPSLFLWAQQGNFPRVFYEELCRKMAKAEIVDADAGHLIPMERPDWVADRALEFCSRG
ncbi:MAG: alpha/beta hydrolase [Myxococcota bacterium]|nr:alpha/beta hydrolase [Myxococcota bacterium]